MYSAKSWLSNAEYGISGILRAENEVITVDYVKFVSKSIFNWLSLRKFK